TPPLTIGAAMLVPLKNMYALFPLPATCVAGYSFGRTELFASSDTIFTPGAETSGFTARSYAVGPRELNVATVSSDRPGVPHVFSAPTVIAYGELPGDAMLPSTIC